MDNFLNNYDSQIFSKYNIDWCISKKAIKYDDAISFMENKITDIIYKKSTAFIWLLEHEDVITAGTSAKSSELLANNLPVIKTGRGGKYTYHGKGQRIIYCLLDLSLLNCGKDIRKFIYLLEEWLINTLNEFNIESFRNSANNGVWINSSRPQKLAAIGVRVKKWVSYHGVAINFTTDLKHYQNIIPCGLSSQPTSLTEQNINLSMQEFDTMLIRKFKDIFL